jgi:phosphoribosylanthranilate isomerase
MPKVKICGITNLEDALFACELGADALGFILYEKSPRFIAPDTIREITNRLPPFVRTVGVFVDAEMDFVQMVMKKAALDLAQLHGRETPAECAILGNRAIKAFRTSPDFHPGVLKSYPCQAFLLDAFVADAYGGTGKTCDWSLAAAAKEYGRIILAGGLNSDNVAEAINKVKPYAVDVSSGVESGPGRKDHAKLKAFFEALP